MGKPIMLDTMGITTDSGATARGWEREINAKVNKSLHEGDCVTDFRENETHNVINSQTMFENTRRRRGE